VVAADRHHATLHAIDLLGHLVRSEFVFLSGVFRQRLVLVLGEERGLVLQLQVHRVLDGRDLVVVETFVPGDHRPVVHRFPVLAVKLGRVRQTAFGPQTFGADLSVPGPQLFVRRERVHHFRAFPVPLRMLVAV
jgi:hypothetical protein